jgi:hypothetical protein
LHFVADCSDDLDSGSRDVLVGDGVAKRNYFNAEYNISDFSVIGFGSTKDSV